MVELPGTLEHQKLLRGIVNYYLEDARIRAVVLFGSMANGTWDRLADLDLDVIVTNEATIRIEHELEGLCAHLAAAGLGEALIVPDGPEAGDVVLTPLLRFSIRYHPLMTTHPNIVENMQVLFGKLPAEIIQNAGRANRIHSVTASKSLINQCIRYAVEVDVALQRKQYWMAVELLHRARHLLMSLYSEARGARRTVQFFEAEADTVLHEKLGKAVCGISEESLSRSLLAMLDLLENDLASFCEATVTLSATQLAILRKVRERYQAATA